MTTITKLHSLRTDDAFVRAVGPVPSTDPTLTTFTLVALSRGDELV